MCKLLLPSLLVLAVTVTCQSDLFPLSVVHVNDFHARFEGTNEDGNTCRSGDTCIGGFSRLYRQIKDLINEKPDSILLNAGDNFQGTLWYTVGRWNVTQEFLNKLPFDAYVLGNHEFDDKVAGVIPYMKALKSPVVVSNIDDSLEPDFQGLYTKSTVIVRNGKKIGIIGVIVSTVNVIASTGNLKFYKESPSVNAEAERLVREEGVFTNIVVSHSGYDVEQIIAANASEKISLIVGGHSHTFLYTGDNPPGPATVEGPYPTIVESKNGKKVLVVQASAFCRYLGNITIFLGQDGEIVDYSGAPIFLASNLPQDEEINKELVPWKEIVDAQGDRVIGSTLIKLDSSGCYVGECPIGDFVTDAMVSSWLDEAEEGSWTYAAIALIHAGGLRNSIEIGNITYADMVSVQPFATTFDVGDLQGKYIKEALEHSTQPFLEGRVKTNRQLLQVSGLRVVLDITRPYGDRVVAIKVRCQACEIPVYEDIKWEKSYRVVVPSYLVSGGDGYTVIQKNIKNVKIGQVDMDVHVKYLARISPISELEQERITVAGQEKFA